EHRVTAGARYRYVHQAVHDHHPEPRERERQLGDRREQPVHDRVHDAPLLERDEDRPRESDEQGGVRHGPESGDERLRRAADAQPAHEPRDDPHREEQRRHLVEPPAETEHADHERGEADEHEREDRAAPAPPPDPRLIATAPTGRSPRRRASSSITGTSAMISSFMLSSTPPSANASEATGTTSVWECPKRRTSQSTPCLSAPVSSTTVNAPPIRNTKKITAAASDMPRGIATSVWNAPTGRAATE